MAITTKTGTISYKAGYAYDTIKQGTQKFPYTATYDSETNTTTVVIGTCQHQYYGKDGEESWALTTITATATEDTTIKTSCFVMTSGPTNGSSSSLKTFSGSPGISTLVIQHTNDIGSKSVKISASTVLRCYPSTSSVTSGNSSQYSGSGSTTVALGTYGGEKILNNAFLDRPGSLTGSKLGASGNMVVAALVMPFKTNYDITSGTTQIVFSRGYIRHRVKYGYSSSLKISGTVTITPTDNTTEAQTVNVSYSGTTTGSLKNHIMTYSSSSVAVQHDITSEEILKYVTVSASINMKFTAKSGDAQLSWTFTPSTTVATGTSYELVIGIPIDDGEELKFYDAYIDDGTAWQSADCFLDARTEWIESK